MSSAAAELFSNLVLFLEVCSSILVRRERERKRKQKRKKEKERTRGWEMRAGDVAWSPRLCIAVLPLI